MHKDGIVSIIVGLKVATARIPN